jgi:outer membrane protein assembly factor BamB
MLPGVLSLLCLAAPGPDTWPGFRGDGSSRTTATLPVSWSPRDNLAWRVSLPGYGQSSPVVWKGTAYLTAVEGPEKETLHVAAFAITDGRTLWKKAFPASAKGKNNPMMSRGAGTPVADERGVVAFFESGDVIALAADGSTRWHRSLGKEFGEFKNNHGTGSSPVQTESAVIVLADHQGPSYLLAMDKSSGKTLWKADRPARSSWTSPVLTEMGGKAVVIASSGGTVTAYDAATGEPAWEIDGLNGNTIPSPTAFEGHVVIGATENRMKPDAKASAESNCCLKLTAAGPEFAWRAKKAIGHHASPLAHAGHVYVVDKNGFVHCLDAKTGESRYVERLDNQQWATPVGAGHRVYFFGKDGITTVLKAGPEFEKVASNRLWGEDDFKARKEEGKKQLATVPSGPPGGRPAGGAGMNPAELEATRASAVGDVVYGVAVVEGTILIRTGTELFCVREK